MTHARAGAATGALLALLALGGAAHADGPAAGVPLARPWFLDGERRVEVERVGPPALDPRGRLLAPIRMRYPGRAEPVRAFVDHSAVVELHGGARERLSSFGVREVRPLMPSIGLWLVEDASGGDGIDVANRLASEGARAAGIQQAVPNLYLRMRSLDGPYTPNDPQLGGQWYFDNLKMQDAWGLSKGDPNSTIVVVDNGCQLDHPDLVAKMDPGLDVVDTDMDPSYDPAGSGPEHGTACAGLSAAATDNGIGIAGGCPACRLRCVRLTADHAIPISADVDAFQFAIDTGAAVVTNSWGFVDPTPVPKPLADAINNVFDNGRGGKGAIVVFAAGNDDRVLGDDELEAVRGVLCVGAINNFDDQAPFTNKGNAIDVVAPTGTLSTDITGPLGEDPGDYTVKFGGTSSACPVVAGIAGLLVGAAPDKTSAELDEVFVRTTRKAPFAQPDDKGHDQVFGYGIVDPVAALRDVLGLSEPADAGADGGGKSEPDDETEAEGCACELGAGARRPVAPRVVWLGLWALSVLGVLRRRGARREKSLSRRSRRSG